jgi:hypothetical protein
MELRLKVEGASELEIARGLKAAREVFEKHGISPYTAHEGLFALEGWDIAGFPDVGDQVPTESEHAAAEVWLEANEAAVKSCCEGWVDSNVMSELDLVMTDAEMIEIVGAEVEEQPGKSSKLQNRFEDEFNSATVVNHPGSAPKDEMPFVAKDQAGNIALVWWRFGTALEDGDEPYYARFDNDVPFEIAAWVPTAVDLTTILETYG